MTRPSATLTALLQASPLHAESSEEASVLGMSRDRLTTVLGAYLTACGVYQIAVHFWPGGPPPLIAPRFGMMYLLSAFLRAPDSSVSALDLALVFWQLAVAISCFINKPFFKAYVVSEILLDLPAVFWIFSLLLLGGGHVFGRADSFILLTVLLLFSVVPLSLAVSSLRRGAPRQQNAPLATR